MKYDLELEKIVRKIKKEKAKIVCIQLPEGLKPIATEIVDFIESKTNANCVIWMGSCFGACDIPQLQKIKPKIDLLIHFGHSRFKRKLSI